MAEVAAAQRGLLDTSVVIDLVKIDPSHLPSVAAICTLTVAELAAGPHATQDNQEKARRQQRLQWAEASFDPLPFDSSAARSFGLVYAAVHKVGRTARRRVVDLMIASVAVANGLTLYTRNPDDFRGLEKLLKVTAC